MTTIRGLVRGDYRFPDFDLEYQVEKHVSMMLKQWPKLDRADQTKRVREMLRTGHAWLWPEPTQGRLFE